MPWLLPRIAMRASFSIGQWFVHFSTADSSTILHLELGEPDRPRDSRDRGFQCKMRDVINQLWRLHPPLMDILDIIGWVPSREQIANPLVYAAKRWKVLNLPAAGRQEKNWALRMEWEFHLDSTGLIFTFKVFSKPKRTAYQNWPPSHCRPQSVVLNKLLI